jgi:hypothetical protein
MTDIKEPQKRHFRLDRFTVMVLIIIAPLFLSWVGRIVPDWLKVPYNEPTIFLDFLNGLGALAFVVAVLGVILLLVILGVLLINWLWGK